MLGGGRHQTIAEDRALSPELSQETADHYVLDVPGKSATVRIRWDVMERMSNEILRGFGAIPRTGMEIGGILLGRAVMGQRLVVDIEDFELVPCRHTRGPYYALSLQEMAHFREAVERHAPRADGGLYAVGFFRSHLRQRMQLEIDDLELLEVCFPHPTDIALLVKLAAGRPGAGAIFFREQGGSRFDSAYLEFPFRRSRPQSSGNSSTRTTRPAPGPVSKQVKEGTTSIMESEDLTQSPKPKRGNFWIPLSFIFLILGVALGLSVGHLMGIIQRTRAAAVPVDAYQLDLAVTPSGDTLQLKWNRNAAVLARARSAVLSIQDGQYSNRLNIDPRDLAGGTLFYRNVTGEVNFKLEVFTGERSSLCETLEYRAGQPPPAKK